MTFTHIAVTGHTKGIGKSIIEMLSPDYKTSGYSRSNGYDLNSSVDDIINDTINCDVLINNAWHNPGQLKLLEAWCHAHKDSPHLVINIGTIGADPFLAQSNKSIEEYINQKKLLNLASWNINVNNYRCKSVMITPGIVDTDYFNGDVPADLKENYTKLQHRRRLITSEEVATTVKFVLDNFKENSFISQVSIINNI